MKRVRSKETGEMGFVINDSFGCCSPNEDLVVYDGTNTGWGTDQRLLEVVEFEKPIPDPVKCGAGKGAECCIFITAGPTGFECERFTGLRDSLIFKTMRAERDPKEPYPLCMKF